MVQPSPIRIEPIAGYSPAIGRLVGMLSYARSTTLAAVDGLTMADLDHLHDAESNSIGALLAHITVVERSYQVLTFEERLMSAEETECEGGFAAEIRWNLKPSLHGQIGAAAVGLDSPELEQGAGLDCM